MESRIGPPEGVFFGFILLKGQVRSAAGTKVLRHCCLNISSTCLELKPTRFLPSSEPGLRGELPHQAQSHFCQALLHRVWSVANTATFNNSEPGLRGELPASCAESMLLVVIPSRFGAQAHPFSSQQ
jgi:hypothetical protein